MTTYELTEGTREEFNEIQAQLTADFAVKMLGAELHSDTIGSGYIKSCTGSNMDTAIFEVAFESGEVKNYLAASVKTVRFLKFTDEPVAELYDSFMEVHANLKRQLSEAEDEARRLQREAEKKADQLKRAETRNEQLKLKALKDFDEMTQRAKATVSESAEFYWALGWLASHVGAVAARMPDYLEPAFIKHFGNEAKHTVVDSSKRTVNGNSMLWTFGFTANLKKVESVPSVLVPHLSESGKLIASTSFIWDLVTNYGFKFGKKQDTLDIMRCVPIEYVPVFNEGFKA